MDTTEPLILDLLTWIGSEERSYAETMEAWRTSCPRLPVWEEANDRGFVLREFVAGQAVVRLSPAGRRLLDASRCEAGDRKSAQPKT
jgi:hypothetical protein